MKTNLRQLGRAGEDLAVAALKNRGYNIIETNYTCPLGEVDIVARHRAALVLVEVKTRRSLRYGLPQEAVSPAKQARLRRLADYYLKERKLKPAAVRFDVVAITLDADAPRLEIIEDAF